MNQSDLAIVTPSVTLNEIYFMNIPFIAIQTASNQQDMYDYIKKEKKFILKKFNKNRLENLLKESLKSK